MNPYAQIILFALLLEFALDLVVSILNLKSLRTTLPVEFEGIYDNAEYEKSQNYTREITRFGMVTGLFDLAVILIFWFSSGFDLVDQWIRAFGFHPTLNGLLFMGSLISMKAILNLPFTIYSTFHIESKYGFNRTRISTFVGDRIKGISLFVILGAPLLWAILWILGFLGSSAWLIGWTVTILFMLTIQFIAPTWIMPLFNKFLPLQNSELKAAILNYARSVSFSIQDIFMIDGSKRSTKANAFFAGFGKNKRIALFDTLIAQQTNEELIAVVAHEVGHYKRRHLVKGLVISIIHTGVVFYLMSYFLSQQALYDAFYMQHPSIYAGLLFFGMLISPIESLLGIGLHALSRKHEYEADRYSAETTKNPAALISALKKLSKNNLSNLTPHPWHVFLNYSHPPLMARIRALNNL